LGRHHAAARHGLSHLVFLTIFDDFAFFGVLTVDIEALLEGFRRRFCGLMTIDDQVAMDFQKVFSKTCDVRVMSLSLNLFILSDKHY
jgi:hypothetical protein